ncbi:MAG: alpha-glucan family phosphorylase [Planctomycetota bacterium]
MDIADRLHELTYNLYWTWHPQVVEIFRDLDPDLWREVNHNPVEMLDRIDAETLERQASRLALEARISQAFHEMHNYLHARNTWGARHAGPLRARPVAHFSAEFGLHESLPIYSGGLGVLAGDHLKSASDLGVPLVGVGLFYAEGYFRQRLRADGWQEERYAVADVEKLPMARATDAEGKPVRVRVAVGDFPIHAVVWAADVGRSRLLLLDANVEDNSDEDRALTAQLYGGDARTRLRQEILLGVGGIQALQATGIVPGALHMNEGHSALAVLALARCLMRRDGRPFDDVRHAARRMSVFSTHTPVAAGHDRFDPGELTDALAPLRDELGISQRDLLALGRVNPDDDNEPFCMTVLGLKMASVRNGVSARHGRVTRRMWAGLWPEAQTEERVPIGHITNGVHVASWLAVPLAPMYARYLGDDWTRRMCEPATWAGVDRIDDVEFWEQHQVLKAHLIDYVARCLRRQAERRPDDADSPDASALDPNVLTIGFARRFAAYKRADLLLRAPDRLERLVCDAERPVQLLFAGRAHPDDEQGKAIVQRIAQAARDPRYAGRIVFIEDHDMNVGRHLVQGTDVWLNTPRRPLEACGTSGQKAVLNGALNVSVLDGWWAEAYDGANGFAIGQGGEHADADRQDAMDADALYEVLEREVAPLYYDRDEHGAPREWIARQKHALRTLPWRFCARRMVIDYTTSCYLPAAGGATRSFAET